MPVQLTSFRCLDPLSYMKIFLFVTELIERLNNKGRQLDAVKFVYAFNLVEKYPPVPLLKAYIKEIKKAAQDVRNKGNNSSESEVYSSCSLQSS